MLFSSILEKYRKRKERRNIVIALIEWLNIDKTQKKLFLESLEILDEAWMEVLYARLIQFVDSIESNQIKVAWSVRKESFSNIQKKEEFEKRQEAHSFNFLLDNV